MATTDLYQQLFGKGAVQDGDVIEMAEHGRIGDVSTGEGYKKVRILDNNGDEINSFGGGTQYNEGDIDASITGTAVMWEDIGNTLRPSSHIYPLPVDAHFNPGSVDSFGHFITGNINNQVDIQFYRGNGSVGDLVTETNANGGTATATGGMATFSATTTANSSSKGVTTTTTVYTAGAELYTLFTAGWTGTGAGTSYQRIGLYDDNNGFFISKEANSFGVTIRKGAADTFTAKASFSEDDLTGAATSKFTRNGTPEAIDLTKLNVFRIRFGWVGSAPISYEVLSPDGDWVTFHKIKQPNLTALPSIEDADLPVTCHVNSGNSGNALTLITNCWAAGTTQSLSRMDATVTDATIAQLTRSVLTGETTAGGGAYVNVKVAPSGAIAADVTATDLDIRNLTATDVVTANLSATDNAVLDAIEADTTTIAAVDFATQTTLAAMNAKLVTGTDIGDVTINNASGASAVNIQDGGNTITVDGTVAVTNSSLTTIAGAVSGTEMQVDVLTMPTVAVTQSGTWDEVGINDSGNSITVDNAQLSVVGTGTEAAALRVTIATDSTGVLSVDDNGSSLTIDGTVTVGNPGDIGGGTQYTEDAAAAANPVGTAPILIRSDTPATQVTTDGDNIAQRGTNYGAAYTQLVTSSGAYIDSVGGGTEYTEDVATANPIVGKAIMVERDDALTAVTPIEGDNIGLRGTAEGALWTQDFNSDAILADTTSIKTAVEILDNAISGSEMQVDVLTMPTVTVNSHAVTNAGTFATQIDGAALTSLQLADDVVATLGTTTYTEASTKGTTIGAVRRDADTTLVDTTNEIGPLQMDANGRLKVEAFSGETLPVSLTSTTVTGTVAVTQSGTWDEVGINDSGNSITVDNTQLSVVGTGTEAAALRVTIASDSTGVLSIDDNGGNLSIDDGGNTITVDGTVTANLAAGTNNIGDVDILSIAAGDNNIGNVDIVSGTITTVSTVTALGAGTTGPMKAEDVAHTTGDQGFPAWGVRNNTPNTATTNADADYSQISTDMVGGVRTALYETDFAVLGTNHVKKYYTNAGAATDGIIWSPAAGKRWYVTDIFINVSAAATVTLEDDLAAGDAAVWKAELAANSGWSHHFGTPLFSGEDAADLMVTTTAGNVYITITGYEI